MNNRIVNGILRLDFTEASLYFQVVPKNENKGRSKEFHSTLFVDTNLRNATVTKVDLTLDIVDLNTALEFYNSNIDWKTGYISTLLEGSRYIITLEVIKSTGNILGEIKKVGEAYATGEGGDVITERYSDINSPNFYYYGYYRNGEWEMLRNTRGNVTDEKKADITNNPSINDLPEAITFRTTLTYE